MIAFVLLVLATWRLSSLIAFESGPFDVFGRIRHIVGVRYDEYSQPTIFKNTFARGIVCFWCVSVWWGFPAAFLSPYSTNIFWFVVNWLAISGLAIMFNDLLELITRTGRR